jgi:hypothetical protein
MHFGKLSLWSFQQPKPLMDMHLSGRRLPQFYQLEKNQVFFAAHKKMKIKLKEQ